MTATSGNAYVEAWLRHRLVLLELLELIGDEHVNFQPWDEALPLGKLALHIATAGEMFVQTVQAGEFRRIAPVTCENMDDVRRVVSELTESTKNALSDLTDEQLNNVVATAQIFGVDLPGKALIGAMRDHEIHHKGQLFVYARMVGVKPPGFVKRQL